MNKKTQIGRGPDRYIFANTVEGVLQRADTALGLNRVGISTADSREIIEGTTVLMLTVTGKRAGEGITAAGVKASNR